jgi:CBS domain containing-hemolysin-like protein
VTALLLIGVVVLVFVNGFFVASEFALVRSRRPIIEGLAGEGNSRARLVLHQLDDMSNYLSACQFGITLASLGIGFLGEPAIARLFEPLFGDSVSHGLSVAISVAIAYLLVTSLHITAGEQIPKIYAIVRAESVALIIARPLNVFNAVMSPFITLLNGT